MYDPHLGRERCFHFERVVVKTFFLFTELDSIKNMTILKKLPDHLSAVHGSL